MLSLARIAFQSFRNVLDTFLVKGFSQDLFSFSLLDLWPSIIASISVEARVVTHVPPGLGSHNWAQLSPAQSYLSCHPGFTISSTIKMGALSLQFVSEAPPDTILTGSNSHPSAHQLLLLASSSS